MSKPELFSRFYISKLPITCPGIFLQILSVLKEKISFKPAFFLISRQLVSCDKLRFLNSIITYVDFLVNNLIQSFILGT